MGSLLGTAMHIYDPIYNFTFRVKITYTKTEIPNQNKNTT